MPILEQQSQYKRLVFDPKPNLESGGGFVMFLKNPDLNINGILVFKSEPPEDLCKEFLKELKGDFGLKSLGLGYMLFDMLKGNHKNAFPLLRPRWKEEYV
jgi:hypothetical protein